MQPRNPKKSPNAERLWRGLQGAVMVVVVVVRVWPMYDIFYAYMTDMTWLMSMVK